MSIIPPETPENSAEITNDNAPGGYDVTTSVEEILKIMTEEEAESVVVEVGFNRGKTLRQIALANYRQLRWFFEIYSGDNNILKAGAKLLFDRAESSMQKAS